jgi:alpha-N-acetylglucosamine transferase
LLLKFANWSAAWNKLHLITLEGEFDSIVFLDADTMVLQNADELLQGDHWSITPGQCKKCEISYGFSGGVFAFKPSWKTYNEIYALASTPVADNWKQSEQEVIGNYLRHPKKASEALWIAPMYNWMAVGCECLPEWTWGTIKIVHYYCSDAGNRPWHAYAYCSYKVRITHCGADAASFLLAVRSLFGRRLQHVLAS